MDYKSFISGCISGFAQTLVGHPFDTLKVWSQNNQKVKVNIKQLYSGLKYPFYTSGVINSLAFGIYTNIYNKTNNNFISGVCGGVISGMVGAPTEYFKIQEQTNNTNMFKILKNASLKDLRIGQAGLREGLAYGIYFPTYFYTKDKLGILTSGGLAGSISWLIVYPIDTIKTRLQSGKYKTIKEAMTSGKIFSGLTPCLTRAFIVNSVGWYVYEYCSKFIKKK